MNKEGSLVSERYLPAEWAEKFGGKYAGKMQKSAPERQSSSRE